PEKAVDGLLVVGVREDAQHARAADLPDHRVDAARRRFVEERASGPAEAADEQGEHAHDDAESDEAALPAHGAPFVRDAGAAELAGRAPAATSARHGEPSENGRA